MSLMGDAALREAVTKGGIALEPAPQQDSMKAASIDLRLGPEAFLGTSDAILSMDEKRLLTIPPGELALVTTLEKLRIGNRYAAQIGLRSAFARKGLALLAGPQIDPGFRGRLHVALVNLSPTDIAIAYREPLVTAVFHDLGSDVEQGYGTRTGDEYQEQDQITGQEIEDIRQHRGYALSEIIREMASLSTNVAQLRSTVEGYVRTATAVMRRGDAYLALFVAAIVALVAWAIATRH
jgi:dCTP deaminase